MLIKCLKMPQVFGSRCLRRETKTIQALKISKASKYVQILCLADRTLARKWKGPTCQGYVAAQRKVPREPQPSFLKKIVSDSANLTHHVCMQCNAMAWNWLYVYIYKYIYIQIHTYIYIIQYYIQMQYIYIVVIKKSTSATLVDRLAMASRLLALGLRPTDNVKSSTRSCSEPGAFTVTLCSSIWRSELKIAEASPDSLHVQIVHVVIKCYQQSQNIRCFLCLARSFLQDPNIHVT